MWHQQILLPLNFLYLQCKSRQMGDGFLHCNNTGRVPHTLLFPLISTFSCVCCGHMGELSWEASSPLELPYQWGHILAQRHGCPCLFGLDWRDLEHFLPFDPHSWSFSFALSSTIACHMTLWPFLYHRSPRLLSSIRGMFSSTGRLLSAFFLQFRQLRSKSLDSVMQC